MQNLTSLVIFAGAIGRLITLTEGALIRCGSRYERFHQIGAIGFVHCLSQSLQAHKPHSTPGFILKGGKKRMSSVQRASTLPLSQEEVGGGSQPSHQEFTRLQTAAEQLH